MFPNGKALLTLSIGTLWHEKKPGNDQTKLVTYILMKSIIGHFQCNDTGCLLAQFYLKCVFFFFKRRKNLEQSWTQKQGEVNPADILVILGPAMNKRYAARIS